MITDKMVKNFGVTFFICILFLTTALVRAEQSSSLKTQLNRIGFLPFIGIFVLISMAVVFFTKVRQS